MFSSEGWPSNPTGSVNTLAISLDSEVTPEVEEVYFKINGAAGSNVAIIVETVNGTRVVEEVCNGNNDI